jgi:hypothetical protein
MRNKTFTVFLSFALLGAFITTLCDGVHVYTHTLSYPNPFLFGQAAWVYPGFVLAFLFMEYAYFLVVNHLPLYFSVKKSVSKGSISEAVEATTAFALVYLMSGLGNSEPNLLSVIFYGTFVLRWLFSYDRLWLLLMAVLIASGGMFAEGALSEVGLVTYSYVDVFNVPLWLGGLYVHGAFALREGMRYFVYGRQDSGIS